MSKRQVLLDGEYFDITGDIQRRNINPWKAAIDVGPAGYSSFSQAAVEEWHGMRGGIGVKYQKTSGTEQLYFSDGLNTSRDGGIILGPEITTAGSFGKTCKGMFDFTSKTFAYGDNLIAEWGTGATAKKQNYITNDDSFDSIYGAIWKAQTFTTASAHLCTHVKLLIYKVGLPGTLTVSIKAVDGSSHPTGADLASGTTSGDTLGTGTAGTWREISFEAGVSLSNATKYAIVIRATGGDASNKVCWRWDESSPTYAGGCSEESTNSGSSWTSLSSNDYMFEEWETATAGAWTSRETLLDDPISHCIVTDGTATYAVVSSLTTSYNSTDGASWTADADMKGYLAVYDHRLCGFAGNTLYYSERDNIDGTITSKAFTAYLGTVHGMFAGKLLSNGDPCLYLNTTEGLWAIDFEAKQIYKQEISFPPYTNAGKTGLYWNSYVWVSTGAGIKKVTPGMTTDVGPDQNDGLPAGYQGTVFDMIGLSDWLIYCVDGGSDNYSSVLRRHGTIGGNQQIYTTSAINTAIECVHYSPSSLYTNGRLWWGEGTGIKYCMFPDFNTDPAETTGYRFATTSGKCIFSTFRPLAALSKLALKVMAVTKGCDTNKKITVYHKINNASTWTSLGEFTSSPTPTDLDFASGAGTEFRTITFAIDEATDAATATPELKSLMFAYLPATKRLRAFTFLVRAQAHKAEDIFTNLHTIQDKDTLVLFYPSGNSNGTSYRGKITHLPENIHWTTEGKEGEIQVTFEEIFRG